MLRARKTSELRGIYTKVSLVLPCSNKRYSKWLLKIKRLWKYITASSFASKFYSSFWVSLLSYLNTYALCSMNKHIWLMHVSQVCRTYAEAFQPDSSSRVHNVSGCERSWSREEFTWKWTWKLASLFLAKKKYVHLRDKTAMETRYFVRSPYYLFQLIPWAFSSINKHCGDNDMTNDGEWHREAWSEN